MQYFNDRLPQIINTSSHEGYYFVVVKKKIDGITKSFQFGISKQSYIYLNKVLSERPFNRMPGLEYEYYFVPGISKNSDNITCKVPFRIIQGNNAKDFHFKLTNELFANLLWFFELKNFEEVKNLKEIEK